MIVQEIRGDVLKSSAGRILFAINAEGYNDAGFAGLVASRHWPALESFGATALGTVWTHRVGRRHFHAVTIHALGGEGWAGSPAHLATALDALSKGLTPAQRQETIAAVRMGAGPVGRAMRAPAEALMTVLADSPLCFEVWSL